MSAPRTNNLPENVLSGALFAVIALPLGVVVIALLSSINFVASIAGYVLYRRGSGGVISRVGAWTITGIVLVTLLVGIWVSLVVSFAGGLGHLGNLNDPTFWSQFGTQFPTLVNQNVLFILLIVVFGALGSFRILGRAFATARQSAPPANLTGQFTSLPPAPTTYHDDIDAPPTGSADDKTTPPSAG
jgi:hypothetical protein